jgi:phytanoyl-CoA hydroxylase
MLPGPVPEKLVQAKKSKILHCRNVQFYSAASTRLISDKRLTGAVPGLIGSPNVQLHHTRMFIKPPEKGSPFPLHQDYPFFPHERQSMIAAIFHFDDAPVEKGCVCVVPGGLNISNEARTTLLAQMRDHTNLPVQDVHKSRGQGF